VSPITLTAAGVRDSTGKPITGPDTATFVFVGAASDLPRVVGAVSKSNTKVVVQFSKPMGVGALMEGNYSIRQKNEQSEAGVLAVVRRCNGGASDGAVCTTAADCPAGQCNGPQVDARHFTVELDTLSQNEVTYVLHVTNVFDQNGNPLAPPQLIQGVEVDPSSATFSGTPPTGTSLVDSDGDGIPDNEEQRGWTVTVTLANGDKVQRQVTSDPSKADTDGDGLTDDIERQIGTDPRSADTDGDGLSDYEEYNIVYSDPTNMDTDGDGITDNLEVEFFKTNALLADSDGDGFTDAQELFEMNRDPRIADLPRPSFNVGPVRLQIDERYTYTDDTGQTQTQDSTTQTSLMTSNQHDDNTMHSSTEQFTGHFEAGTEPQACCDAGSFYLEPIFHDTVITARAPTTAISSGVRPDTSVRKDNA
jgi:hypothetical protein